MMSAESRATLPLLENEHVLWSSRPDWQRAAKPLSRGLAFLATLASALLASLGAIAVIHFADDTEPATIYRAASAVAILIAVTFVVLLWWRTMTAFVRLFARERPRPDAIYALTNQRLIVHVVQPPLTLSVTREARLLSARLQGNGATHDLTLWFCGTQDGEFVDVGDPLVLLALPDGESAKATILEAFRRPVDPGTGENRDSRTAE